MTLIWLPSQLTPYGAVLKAIYLVRNFAVAEAQLQSLDFPFSCISQF